MPIAQGNVVYFNDAGIDPRIYVAQNAVSLPGSIYDILQGLRVVTALGFGGDERSKDARDLLLSKGLPDGTWPMEATYLRSLRRNFVKDEKTGQWHSVWEEGIDLSNLYKSSGRVVEVPSIYLSLGEVGKPNPWVTLNALRALKDKE